MEIPAFSEHQDGAGNEEEDSEDQNGIDDKVTAPAGKVVGYFDSEAMRELSYLRPVYLECISDC